ncbi:hypothetical protein BC830DRAFT_623362 [Chytriomyces sp. MP71]|nr:hypothetical protein BC830DRAFT_623362 [Chytriomyces sp. MP71]
MRETWVAKVKARETGLAQWYTVGPARPVDTPRARRLMNPGVAAESGGAAGGWGGWGGEEEAVDAARENAFPWHAESLAPAVTEILCGYKDYNVEFLDLQGLIGTRLLEGFAIKSISVSSGKKREGSGKEKEKEKEKERDKDGSKGEKLEITLMRPWLPNVTIQYTIKARISADDIAKGRKPFLACLMEGKMPRIELNILAHQSFAISFVNVVDMDSKKNDRLVKLHNYLR